MVVFILSKKVRKIDLKAKVNPFNFGRENKRTNNTLVWIITCVFSATSWASGGFNTQS